MSRHRSRHARGRKGRGSVGCAVTFVLVLFAAAFAIFFAADTSYQGARGKVYSVVYPQKYTLQVEKYAAEFGVEEPLVYAVIRTESNFRSDAQSHAGAVGLMQLMPSTFDWLQEKLDGEILYTSDALTDPDVNIRYGTYLLSCLLEQYDGNMSTAVAAYNAGSSTVNGWLADSACSSDGKTLSVIPYEETKNYVDRVEGAYDKYKMIYYQNNR